MNSRRVLDRSAAILPITCLALLAVITCIGPAAAKSSRDQFGQLHTASAPMLAIVALGEQRLTIYNAEGKMLQAPVSTGATGLETPAGIYSVVQKEIDHHSNVYEDGAMPFMQRITWTGIALHSGALPGYPASHGCVRMPRSFAQRLFDSTDVGMRVIVVSDDIAPHDIDHSLLFQPSSVHAEHALTTMAPERSMASDRARLARLGAASLASDASPSPGSAKHMQLLQSIASAKSAAAEAAAKRVAQAKQAAVRKGAEAAPAAKMLVAAQAKNAKAEELLKVAERRLETATSLAAHQQAEQAKATAVAKVAATQAKVQAAKQQAQVKRDAAAHAAEDLKAAEKDRQAAIEVAHEAMRDTAPVSVFISRKTQRLYIRKANQPVFEGPVKIGDASQPIGTYIFTALNYPHNGAKVRWSVVSMYRHDAAAQPATRERNRSGARNAPVAPADVAGAKAALDRIAIAPDVVERISKVVLPGSSLIISDEGASIETGKDTDFVVLISGEPQGGIKSRRRNLVDRYRHSDEVYGRPSFKGFGFFSGW